MKRASFLFVGPEELGAAPQKHHSPIVKHPDACAEQERFPDIMSDKESRLPETIAQVEKLLLQFHAGHRVGRRQAQGTALVSGCGRRRASQTTVDTKKLCGVGEA